MNRKTVIVGLTILLISIIISKPLAANETIDSLERIMDESFGNKKIDVLNQLAWEYRRINPEKATSLYKQALEQSLTNEYTKGLAFANKNAAVVSWIKADFEEGLTYASKAKKHFLALNIDAELGNIENTFGLIYWNLGAYPDAILSYKNAVEIFQKTNDSSGLKNAYNNLGIIYFELNDYTTSLDYYIRSLKIAKLLNDKYGMNNSLANIGMIYSRQENYIKAIEYYKQALKIDLELDDKIGLSNTYSAIGTWYFNLNMIDSSMVMHQDALKYAEILGDKKNMGHSYSNIGEIFLVKESYNDAMKYFQKSLEIREASGDKTGLMIIYQNIGNVYKATNENDKAIEFFHKGLTIAEELNSFLYIIEYAHKLSGVYEKTNQYKKALEYQKRIVNASDSLAAMEKSRQLIELQTLYETEKKEQQIILLNKEKEEEVNHQKTLVLIILLLVVISLLIIYAQILKMKKNKKILKYERDHFETQQRLAKSEIQRKEQELELKKGELRAFMKKFTTQNELYEGLKQKLVETKQKMDRQIISSEKIEAIGQLVSSKILTEEDWLEFKRLFDQVYKGYFIYLKENFTDITTAEQRLCALIKLNLNSKEIAAMLGISPDSVKKLRYRLRKKMSLENDENLDEYIADLYSN